MTVATQKRYTVINGKVYDVTKFLEQHPGGRALASIAVGRDATIMFESYHMRHEVALARLNTLPQPDIKPQDLLSGKHGKFDPIPGTDQAVETYPSPRSSEFYETVHRRVRKEIMEPLGKKTGRGGVGFEASCVVVTWFACYLGFLWYPNLVTAVLLGAAASWIGTGLQHTANHGGLTLNSTLNHFLGLMDDVACCGSSLVWRYHHHVSHHAYTNDVEKDQDVYSSFPLVRLDDTQPRKWFHKYQALYAPVMFGLLFWSIQMQDVQCFLDQRTFGVRFLGLSNAEKVQFWSGKALHFGLHLLLPSLLHGFSAVVLPYFLFTVAGSIILATTFIVSHNILESKTSQISDECDKDWARLQVETSASWGGPWAGFFTGGLNFQIEHHLFPGLAHNLYYDVSKIVEAECIKRGIPYNSFDTLGEITIKMVQLLHRLGNEDKPMVVSSKKLQ